MIIFGDYYFYWRPGVRQRLKQDRGYRMRGVRHEGPPVPTDVPHHLAYDAERQQAEGRACVVVLLPSEEDRRGR